MNNQSSSPKDKPLILNSYSLIKEFTANCNKIVEWIEEQEGNGKV